MPTHIHFSVRQPGCDRIHHVNEHDIRVVLSRLPPHLWQRLRAVHFNDRSVGGRILGYVNDGRREIALCALPPPIACTRILCGRQTPEQYGAQRGKKWPELAIRRFLLYHVFLHELGHLQLVDADRPSDRLRFAREKLAQEFAMKWRHHLWSMPFDHLDPVHNPPNAASH